MTDCIRWLFQASNTGDDEMQVSKAEMACESPALEQEVDDDENANQDENQDDNQDDNQDENLDENFLSHILIEEGDFPTCSFNHPTSERFNTFFLGAISLEAGDFVGQEEDVAELDENDAGFLTQIQLVYFESDEAERPFQRQPRDMGFEFLSSIHLFDPARRSHDLQMRKEFHACRPLKCLVLEWNQEYKLHRTRTERTTRKALTEEEVDAFCERVDPAYTSSLCEFFSKLSHAEQIVRGGHHEQSIERQVVEAVRAVVQGDEATVSEIVYHMSNAVSSCQDRPVEALSRITFRRKVLEARGDRQKLRILGQGVMYLSMIDSLLFTDEILMNGDQISVMLEVQTALKEPLNLPVETSALHYENTIIREYAATSLREKLESAAEEQFEEWLSNWDEWRRQDRLELVKTLAWENLECCSAPESLEYSGMHFDLVGELNVDPVLIRKGIWSFHDVTRHWIETGTDLLNVPMSCEEFAQIRRLVL